MPFALLGKQKFIKRWQQCCQYNLNPFVCMYVCMYVFIVILLQLSQFPPIVLPCPSPFPQSIPTLLSMSTGQLYLVFIWALLLSSFILLTPPLLSLSVRSLFPCLWFYFAHLFVVFIIPLKSYFFLIPLIVIDSFII